MAQNLIDYLKAHSCEGFKPVPHYFASGDYLTLFLSDVRCRTQRVDETLSIYISEENGELVGCKIKGVRLMLDEASSFGVAVDAGKLKLGFLFFIGAQMAKDEHKRKYYEVKDLFKDTPIDDVALSAEFCNSSFSIATNPAMPGTFNDAFRFVSTTRFV